jgi:DUF1365 family protein
VVRSALYTGTLIHSRRVPAENVFRYRVCFYVLDLDELPELERRLALFSYNRRNVLTFRDRDHLGDEGRSARENLVGYLAGEGIDLEDGRILLLTNLRVLGYVFNPVSFYYCYDRHDELACIVAEVSNTFDEMLPYVLSDRNRTSDSRLAFAASKRMHVSPFFPLDQEYRFDLAEPGERVHARVDVWQGGERRLGSVLAGEREQLTNASLARALVQYPFMPQRVITLIHWQALKLWAKRVPFHHKPPFQPGAGSVRQP